MCDTSHSLKDRERSTATSRDRGELFAFQWGTLSLEEIRAILDAIPLDVNFVDKDDLIQYYNESSGKIFTRKQSVIGQKVQMCHPEKSREKVTRVLEDLRSGKKEMVEMRGGKNLGRPTRWRYIALRNDGGGYIGCLCITDFLDG